MLDPRSIVIYGLGAAVIACAAWGWIEHTRGATARQHLAEFRLNAEKARADAESAEREKERQWAEKVQEVSTHAQAKINVLEGDLARARTAADRLRAAASLAASRARETPTPANPGPGNHDPDPLDLLVNVLARHSAELVVVGEYADRLRAAGEACERAWEVTR